MDIVAQMLEQARELERSGSDALAASLYRHVLAEHPDQAAAAAALARLLCRGGELSEALGLFSHATQAFPDDAGLWLDFGLALARAGHDEMARRALLSAASLWPDDPSLLSSLGDALRELKLYDEAIRQYQRLCGLMPGLAAAHNNLGICLLELGRRDEAFEPFQRAYEADPDMPEAIGNLAMLSVERGLNQDAIALYARLRGLRPDLVQAPLNQGVAYYREGRLGEAAQALRDAIRLSPDEAQAHYNLAQVLLLDGQIAEGFAEYEWRWQCHDFPSPRLLFFQPRWNGEALAGRILLVHAEQGLGDVLQFCRLLPRAAKGGKVLFLCPDQLMDSLASLPDVTLVRDGDPLPAFDLYCPLMSLPHLLGPGDDITPPYLTAPQRPLFDKGPGLHVGLVWSGNPQNGRNHVRSVPLAELAALPQHPGIVYHSLQYRPDPGWQDALPFGVDDLSSRIASFSDLAAAMAQLDLVISMCSAPVHLAGALGRPCWVMLHHLPDWRWGMRAETNRWYPSIRLYRQPSPKNWAAVVAELSADLIRLAENHTSHHMGPREQP